MIQDMTKGSVLRQIVIFAIPLFIGTSFNSSITWSTLLWSDVLSVKTHWLPWGLVFQLCSYWLPWVMGLTTGASIVVSQLFGPES